MRLSSLRAFTGSALLFALACSPAFAQSDPQSTSKPVEEISPKLKLQLDAVYREKASRTPAMRKMDQDLIFAVRQAKGENLRKDLPDLEIPNIVNKDGTVDVELVGPVTNSLIAQLRRLGGEIQTAYPKYKSISARLRVSALESAALLPGVQFLKTQDKYMTNSGTKQSEGDKSLRADEARTRYGLTGAGVKIGILSDSDKYRENSQSTGDLPATIDIPNAQDGRSVTGNTGEGTAMMELAYDLAPGSSYAFNTAYSTQAAFAQHYTDLFNAGCKVIADDISYFAEPAFQDGPIAKSINDIVKAGGIVFSAAGNEGNVYSNYSGVWEGDYVNSGTNYVNGSYNFPMHNFGGTTRNQITNRGNGYLTLQWNDQWNNCTSDYDLFVLNQTGGLTAYSASTNTGGGTPFEQCTVAAFSSPNTRSVMVTKYSGGDFVLRANMLRGKLATVTGGQTYGHPASEYCIGTGAIYAATAPQGPFTATDVPNYYSSDGYRRIFYNEAGQLITTNTKYASAVLRQQPVITSVDGVTTTVPGFVPFYGTSAAAPQAAAVAALLKEFAPDATPTELRNALTTGAVDLLTQGWDKTSGFGAVNTMGAIKVLLETKTKGATASVSSVCNVSSSTVTLDLGRNAPPAGLTVNIATSGDTSQFNSVPSSVVVPAGQSTVSFPVSAKDAGSGSVTFSFKETYTNAVLGSATLSRAVDVAISSIQLGQTTLLGGVSHLSPKVNLNRVTPGDFSLEYEVSDPSVATVSGPTVVPTGAATTTLTVTANPVSVDTPVTLRVRHTGDAWTEVPLTIKAPTPVSFKLNPTLGYAGGTATGMISLNGPAPAGYAFDVASSNPSLVSVTSPVTFGAGAHAATFTANVGSATDTTEVTLTLSRNGVSYGTTTYKVLVVKVVTFALKKTSVKGGTSVTGTIKLDRPAPPTGLTVNLVTSGDGATVPTTVTIPGGQKQATFTITTDATTSVKTVTISVDGSSVPAVTLTINP